MARSGKRGGGAGDREGDEPSPFKQALADVKPLKSKSPRRVMPAPVAKPAPVQQRGPTGRSAGGPLTVERESNGIVLAKRPSTHASIVSALEDPQLEVDARCDLHGLRAQQAESEARQFIRDSQQRGKRWVLVIVGKGLHSPGGKGTLQARIVDMLSKGPSSRRVVAFGTAPRRLGGTGALVVRLA